MRLSKGVERLTITEVQLNIRDDVIEIDADPMMS
jgi:hypothetical protein